MASDDQCRVSATLSWEHTHRELLAALIFAHEMSERGLDWTLRQVNTRSEGLDPNSVYFLPYYYDPLDLGRYHYEAAASGAWMVNLSYEQMHFRCGRGYLLPDGKFAREQMLHCAWGQRYRQHLLDHGIPDERIRLTGHPRFDIYSRPSLLFERDELAGRFNLDPDKPWVLIPYNFNLSYIDEGHRKNLEKRNYALTDEFIQGVTDAREAFTLMVRELTDRFPDVEFILRVHPAGYESETVYKDEPRLDRNLHLISAFDIANWIRAAALVVVWNSTSAMEALVAGVPAISYEPYPFHTRFDYDVNRILPTFSELADVSAVVAQLPDPELDYDWALFESWYATRDGNNVARQLAIVEEAAADFGRYACQLDFASRLQPRLRQGAYAMRRGDRDEHKDKLAQVDPAALELAIRSLKVDHLAEILR